jgi:hypothetical protein
MNLLSRVFAVVSDARYVEGLWALLNSIYAYHGDGFRVFLFDAGLTQDQLSRLAQHPLTLEVISASAMAFRASGAWELKQQVMAHLIPRARCVYLLDADLVLTSRVDDVFEAAEQGAIVSSTDGAGIGFGNEYGVYASSIVAQEQPYLNSGALCLDVNLHWALVGLWAFSCQYMRYSPEGGRPLHLPGHGDQGSFNAIAALLGKAPAFKQLPEAEWCDCTIGCSLRIEGSASGGDLQVRNLLTGGTQRVVHSSGAKWWTAEGARRHQAMGDKQKVFTHFYELIPWNLKEHERTAAPVAREVRVLIGICSCARRRSARDAVRRTWLQSLPGNYRAFFFGRDFDPDETDVIKLDVPDGYENLPEKVGAFFRHIAQTTECEFVFKCDDDTYLVPDRLESLLGMADMVGDKGPNGRDWVSGGAGYCLSRTALERLAEASCPKTGAEDVIFSRLAKAHGLSLAKDSRLRPDLRVVPTAQNELITVHGANPNMMIEIHEMFRASCKATK